MNQSYDMVEGALRLRAGLAAHLDVADIDVDEPLVDHVGDALSLDALVDVVRACGGTNATRVDVLACATLRELAALVERTGGAAREPDAARSDAPAVPEDADDAPASPAQEDLWLAAQVQDEGAAYHLSIALRFDAPVDCALMKRALAEVVARHPSLRTTFRHDADGLRQCVRAETEVDWSETALPAPAEVDERESRLRDALTRFAQPRFDLLAGPLLRACLYRVAPDGDVLQVVVHHIVFDAWSRMVVSRDIVDAYRTLQAGRAIAWGGAAASPGAFARGQRAALTPERCARLREYWRAQLADVPQVLDLPTDFTRPAARDGAGETALRTLPAALAERLAAVGARHGASLFMTLMAAWQILLWRCSRQHAFAIGTPMAARDAGAFESTVGYLVNTVALRACVRADEPFSGLLARVAQATLDAYEHKALPLREVLELAGASRNPSHTPLFQVMFEFHNERAGAGAEQAEPVRAVQHDVGAAKYDLSLEIAHRHDGLACAIEYATALFARSSIDGMLAQYEALLEQIATMPDAPVASLSCMPDDELDKVTRTWNATAFERTGSPLIHARFDARVRECPDAIALRAGAASMTFAALGERVDALAGRLLERTGGEPKRIAICFERSFDMLIAILATLKAGCAYVPIDPQLPADRVDFMLSDSAAAMLLTIRPIRRERFPSLGVETLCLDEPAPPRAAPPREAAPAVDPQAAAYVLYTSGSTGTPKGVVVTHANVTNLLDAMEASYPVGAHERYLLKTNYAFDVSVPELFGWFVGRGSLAILAPQAEGSPDLIVDAVLRHGVTHVNFTPSLLRQFVTEAAADVRFAREHRLEHVFVVGEELTSALANDALSALRPASIYNMYGPTEATVFATGYAHAAPIPNGKVPIGRALGNMRAYVLDERMRPMPIGMPGDLYIAGEGVARGYLNREALTAQRFLPDPFAPGGSIYMTGDLARWTRDGMLEFLGRTDQQIKIRGYRVELDEIASALNAHPLVDEAAVILKREPDGAAQLVAYVVAADGMERSAAREDHARFCDALVSALKQRLPDYMAPAAYVLTPSLPKGITGKLNRKALEALPVDAPARHAAPGAVAPRNDAERTLCGIWQSVLRMPDLGVTDNFFAVGGDSILSIQAAARARQQGFVFSARDIFRHQTVELLAANVRCEAPGAQRQASAGDMPLLPIHHWFFSVDSTHVDHYHQSRLLDVPAGVDADFLAAWLAALVARHDALRLRFRRTEAGWRAHFAAAQACDAAVRLTVCGAASARPAEATVDAFFADARRSVRLADGPLFVAALAAGAHGRGRLLLIGHHAVVDGVSWRVIVEDLRQAFAQWAARDSLTLGPKRGTYQAWAQAVVAAADSPALRAERAHWLRVLRAPAARLRLDRGARGDTTRRAARVRSFGLNAADTRALLADTHRAYRTQTIELLLAGLLLAAHRWQGHDTLRVALEGHGREAEVLARYGAELALLDVGETLGWFTSYYPQLLTLAERARASDPVAAAIMAVKAQYRATPHHGLGYGILRHVTGDPELAAEEAAHAPEIVFNYLGQFDVADEEAADIAVLGMSSRDDISAARPREHELGINGEVKDGCLAFEIDYSTHAFDDESIAALGEHFMHALREIAAHCNARAAWCPTPEDFPLAVVTQDELAAWHARHPKLDTLYPATAIQWGMVFHSLLPNQASAYTNQVYATVGGDTFDAARLRRAWEAIVERHAALRTAFVGFEREQPLQIVSAHVACPWRDIDHRHLAPDARDAAFQALLAADKAAPFDFGCAPLMRFHLVRHDDAQYRFVWTYHHAVLDGWSVQLVWSDLLRIYEALADGRPAALPAAAQFDAVLAWRQQRASDADRRYWREQIGARTHRTVLGIEQTGLAGQAQATPVVERSLDEAATRRLVEAARACRVTLAAMLQAAWALMLGRGSGETAPVFGVTTSGRAIDLPGIETIVGPLIATVPARVDIDASMPLRDWLRAVHDRHVEREAHAQLVELIDIQRESGMRGGQSLFDSLLVVENYPLAELSAERILGLRDYGYAEETHYGLTVSATPGTRLRLEINFDRSRYHIEDIETMADNLKAVLNRIPDDLERPVGDVPGGEGAARAASGGRRGAAQLRVAAGRAAARPPSGAAPRRGSRGGHARAPRARLQRSRIQLRRVEPRREPDRESADAGVSGSRHGFARRRAHRAQRPAGPDDPRDLEDRRGLHSDRSRPARAAHARDARLGEREGARRRCGSGRRRAGRRRRAARRVRRSREGRPAFRGQPRCPPLGQRSELRAVHVGIDRQAEGRDDRAHRHVEQHREQGARPRDGRGQPRRAELVDELRRVRLADVHRADQGRHDVRLRRPRRQRHRRAGPSDGRRRRDDPRGGADLSDRRRRISGRAPRLRASRIADVPDRQRRDRRCDADPALVRAVSRDEAHQRLRPHRGVRRHHASHHVARRRDRESGPRRPCARQFRHLHRRRRAAPGADRHEGGDRGDGRRHRTRLHRHGGCHRAGVREESVSRPLQGTPLPDGRHRRDARGRRADVSRPQGPAGEDSRDAHRARGGRGEPACDRRGPAGRGARDPAREPRGVPLRVCRAARRRARRDRRSAEGEAAAVHGAVRLPLRGGVAATAERQGGPQPAARAVPERNAARERARGRAAHAGRASPDGDLP